MKPTQCGRVLLLFLTVAYLSGCTRDSVPTQSLLANAGMEQDPGPDPEPTPAGPTLDELFLAVAKDAPTFGGLVIEPDGALAIRVVDTAQGAAAEESVTRVLGAAVQGRAVRLVAVRYTFVQLHSWREELYAGGLPEGIRLVDVDEGRNVVRVGTTDETAAEAVRSRARVLRIPDDAVVAEVVQAFTPLTDYLTSRIRPVMGGLGIVTTAHGCTLGFKAKKSGSLRYVVTNAHCTTTFGAVDDDDLGQPLLQSNYWIGYEVDDPAFTSTNCASGYTCRWADAALFQCDTVGHCTIPYTIAQTTSEYTGSDWSQSGSSTLTAEPWYVVGELSSGSLTQGTSLSKVGATSGWTGGTIGSTCYDVQIATGKLLRCQYNFSGVSRAGDSGSPVFQYESATGKSWLAGILWGSDGSSASVFSPIAGVKTDLGSMTVSSPLY